MTKSGPILITFAWAMELIGVTGGALNSTYTTFGDDLPVTLAGYIPAVPMVALAAAELAGQSPRRSSLRAWAWGFSSPPGEFPCCGAIRPRNHGTGRKSGGSYRSGRAPSGQAGHAIRPGSIAAAQDRARTADSSKWINRQLFP